MSHQVNPQCSALICLVSDIARILRLNFRQQLESISLSQVRVLMCAAQNQGIRQIEIAQRLGIKPMTIARLLDQLEAENLIERRVSPGDRRAYQIFLGEDSEERVQECEQALLDTAARTFSGLEVDEVDRLYSTLYKIRNNFR